MRIIISFDAGECTDAAANDVPLKIFRAFGMRGVSGVAEPDGDPVAPPSRMVTSHAKPLRACTEIPSGLRTGQGL